MSIKTDNYEITCLNDTNEDNLNSSHINFGVYQRIFITIIEFKTPFGNKIY